MDIANELAQAAGGMGEVFPPLKAAIGLVMYIQQSADDVWVLQRFLSHSKPSNVTPQ